MTKCLIKLCAIVLAAHSAVLWADDTEIYVAYNASGGNTVRPKVLIILDNSGSMSTLVEGNKPEYDPATTYTAQGSVTTGRLYWSTDGRPPAADSDQYFLASSNRCATSSASLSSTGFYTDYFSAWRAKNGTLRWRTVNDSSGTRGSSYVDCAADVNASNAANPGSPAQGNGYPLNTNAGPYTANVADSNVDWNGMEAITVFTANYMNWYHDASLAAPSKSRIQIAKETVTNIINSNPNVDFGLMVFNRNGSGQPDGGRVIARIVENMTAAQRTSLVSTVSSITASSWTPLAETMYEAYRYIAGEGVYFGNDDPTQTPARDTAAESGTDYISPIGDCQQIYVIYMTDGEPTNDTAADTLIGALPGIGAVTGSRLDELTGWLYKTDLDGNSSNGSQRVITYTIGFESDQQLLSDAAAKGGGRYYTAYDAAELQDSFQGAINEILSTDTTFTAPSVAVNSFNQSRSLDDVFIALFRPEVGPRWSGNLKKLRINSTGTLVDANNIAAIDPTTGEIKDTAQTLWSTAADGTSVTKGGVGALLAARDPNTRVIKTNTGASGVLENFATSNTNLTEADFSVATADEKNTLINWARGVDVLDEDDDEITTDTRPWVLGDPLHSRPLVINYGARTGYSTSNPDVRVLMGTNAGFMHMFKSDTGAEAWAFMPKEMADIQKTLMDNSAADSHVYGVDGTAAAYVYDNGKDGTISGASDKVYLYFGLRRGGMSYYALDITDPDNPSFMWHVSDTTTGFGELAQTWSTPVVTKIPGHTGPVLIVGGGYDVNKDLEAVGTNDSEGRGIFIIDGVTGALIWSATPAANGAKNLQVTGFTDSIPAPVNVMDSNGDGLSDRIYFGDTGGNIWRVDMPGNTLPTAAQTTWSVFKLASFGGETDANDRRFFNKVDVVRGLDGTTAYDGIGVGSGNREHPNSTGTTDRYYLVRDLDTRTTYHGAGGTAVPSALGEGNLYDATANLIQDGSAAQQTAALTSLAGKQGWYITLERGGEKNLSPSITIGGTVFFTSFAPDTSASHCVPVPGKAYLYAVSLVHGTAVFAWDATTSGITKADRDVDIGARLPDSVTPHFGDDTIRVIGVGAGDSGKGSYDVGYSLTTMGTYWYKVAE